MYCQINVPEKTALRSDLSSAAHHTRNQGQMPPSAFQVLSRQAPGYLTDSSPASPFQNPRLQPNGFAVLKQALQSLPRPHAFDRDLLNDKVPDFVVFNETPEGMGKSPETS